MAPIIEFKDFSFKYRAQKDYTLHDINLTINEGEKVLIIGPSGSGKSTLSQCLNGLIPHSYPGKMKGHLTVNGKNPKKAGIFGMSETVGTVLQDTDGQFIGLTVAEDIAFALENDCVKQEKMKKRVHDVAHRLSIEKLLDHRPNELSGGQKQRVSLAGVMVDDVDILLFDEPLANLDPATGKNTIELIDEIHKQTHKTIIIIEHRLEDVLYKDVDRIIMINDGRIVADMSSDALLASSLLEEAGIREPLYLTACKYAGVTITQDMHPSHIESFDVSRCKEALQKWYEKISMSYSGTLQNSITTKEDQLLHSNLIKDWNNGMRHTIPISASFTLLKYINIVPMFNYTERWYSRKVNQSWDTENQSVVRDTIYGFNRVYNYNLSLSANTKAYVFFQPNKKIFGDKIQMVRHVISPSISFSYAPDFSASRYGYYKTYTKTDMDGNVSLVEYSPYQGAIYSYPGRGKTGSISFDIGNNIEMKIKSDSDSTGVKKVSIIDELGANLSYNLAAKQQPWSNLSTRLRLKWGKFALNLNTTWMTYAYEFDKNGNVVVGNKTEWSYGRFGRFQGMSKNLSYTFNNQSWKKWVKGFRKLFYGEDDEEEVTADNNLEDGMELDNPDNDKQGENKKDNSDGLDENGYMKFSIPWSFSVSYGITMAEDRSRNINVKNMRYPFKFVHNLNFSGNVKLSSNWIINFSSGWDFTNNELSMTTVNVSRDMHCFNISAGFVFGPFTSYHVTMRANASTLTDALKYDKKSSYSSSIQWY